MKLRNKKTGLTGKLTNIYLGIYEDNMEIDISILLDNSGGECIDKQFNSIDELKKFFEDWEDDKEPLIKDSKIRKAVRAWAEAIGATRNIVFNGSWKICSFFYENNKGGFEKLLIYGDNDLEELKRYTITELCGEEG